MQNATRPGFAAPVPSPPQVPMMPTGYSAPQYPQFQPQPQVLYVSAPVKNVTNNTKAAKTVNSIGSKLIGYTFKFTVLAVVLMVVFAVAMKVTGLDKLAKNLAPWMGPIITGLLAITGVTALTKAGFFGKAKKAEALAEDAKAAREAGDLEKAKKLEKEAAEAKAEAEAAGEEVEGVTESGKLAKEGEQATQEAREAEAVAQEARQAEAVTQEARQAEATAQELREFGSFIR